MPAGAWLGRDLAGRHPAWHHGVPVPVPQRALELQPGGTDQPAEARYKVVFRLQYETSLSAAAPEHASLIEQSGAETRECADPVLPRSSSGPFAVKYSLSSSFRSGLSRGGKQKEVHTLGLRIFVGNRSVPQCPSSLAGSQG